MRLIFPAASTLAAVFLWRTAFDIAAFNDRALREFPPEVRSAAHFHPIPPHFGAAVAVTVATAWLWAVEILRAER